MALLAWPQAGGGSSTWGFERESERPVAQGHLENAESVVKFPPRLGNWDPLAGLVGAREGGRSRRAGEASARRPRSPGRVSGGSRFRPLSTDFRMGRPDVEISRLISTLLPQLQTHALTVLSP